ncbi:hypothetical protein ALP82_101323 [Pseudomonas savastanoi pv. fraxini]|uniref:Uncharacterized protein n=1 Tax=Pseudomonas savastanoi pv. nerii TaxID=360921 RepID=A0AB74BIG7_PSESS|nr:hypothetical protein ALP79_101257 [Pseudomonas savastanoi pv. fraxini]RML68784.1 hypothetical protein ALQ90_101121 [Pseudomonas savastanoi pv. savastanoi]RMT76284.1 hypothetical protein ALP42_101261 [Pseudomonas savastanoi pv. nerii]RMR67296.1 hypothetical protein ALP82_101323 [Pseudomonas savastanoi pv. fraxini]RMR71739.1 hypothetical protein ALP81_101311 [Pseudomonas savastanoi pv. fraxini]
MVMALSNSISHGPARTMIGSFGNALRLIVTFAGCSVVAHGFYAPHDHTAAALHSGSALIRKPHTSLRPFFFSNGLLSFAPAMPRIRLRFQTLLFGLPAFMRCAALEPDGMFSWRWLPNGVHRYQLFASPVGRCCLGGRHAAQRFHTVPPASLHQRPVAGCGRWSVDQGQQPCQ